MKKFCIDSFWDSDISWNNTWPQLTDCFQTSFLLPLPSFYFCLFLPIYLYSLFRKKQQHQLWENHSFITSLFLLKMTSCSAMLVIEVAALILDFRHHQDDAPGSHVFASSFKILSFILVMFTIILEQKRSTFNSPGLLMFFFLLLVTHIVPFYSKMILQEHQTHTGLFILFYTEYLAMTLSFILHCFNNKTPDQKVSSSSEERASILSRLTIWWTTSLIVRGYKKPLTEDDIYPLNVSERATTIIPEFLHYLSKHIQHYNKQQKKSQSKRPQSRAQYMKHDDADQKKHEPLIEGSEQQVPASKDSESKMYGSGGIANSEGVAVELKDSSKKSSEKWLGLILFKVILYTFRRQIIKCCLIVVMVSTCNLCGPLLIKELIEFMSQDEEQDWHGYLLASLLFLCSGAGYIITELFFLQAFKFGLRVKSALLSTVYRKSLCLNSEARQLYSTGEIMQLLSRDCESIGTLADETYILLVCPTELIVGIILVYRTIGVATFTGLVIMFLCFFLKSFVARKQAKYDFQLKEYGDQRMKMSSQLFSGIKVLKLNAWEEVFKNQICAIREKELAAMFKYDLLGFFNKFAWSGAVFFMIYFMFLTHVLTDDDHHLTASTVFVTMAYFVFIRRASNLLESAINYIISGMNSAQRVVKFLMLNEIKREVTTVQNTHDKFMQDTDLAITDGTFSWSADSQPVLKNINMEIPSGSLVAVVGMVGCGKTSLLSAILGEMVVHGGSVYKKGKIAYMPQEAWIQNDSVRNNILFGSELREDEYNRVLQDCALMADLSILPAGDRTEIGEKGINLSGGQKQRVSLARAVYQKSDVYLLDDPLSAVDSHVGQHIFKHVIGRDGLLKDKTRILVTHGIQWLSEVDKILVMRDGVFTEQGSLDELMAHNGPFAQFLSQFLIQQQQLQKQKGGDDGTNKDSTQTNANKRDIGSQDSLENENSRRDMLEKLLLIESQKSAEVETGAGEMLGTGSYLPVEENMSNPEALKQQHDDASGKGDEDEGKDKSKKLIEDEELRQGRVHWSIYKAYIESFGYISVAALVLLLSGYLGFDSMAGFWLTFWVDNPLLNNQSVAADSSLRYQENMYYLGIYSLWGILGTVMIVLYSALRAWAHVHSSRIIHQNLITNVLSCPIQFFNSTPVGRLLSRFTRDIAVVDSTLLMWTEMWFNTILTILSYVLVIIINIPVFLIALIPIVPLFYIIEKFYLPTTCQLRRLERKCMALIFSHASESFAGTSVIRALGEEERFISNADQKIDFCQKMKFASLACQRWLSIRLCFLSSVLVLCAGLMSVVYRDELSPGLTGLSLSLVMNITLAMQLQTLFATFMEMDIVSMERILQYSNLTPEAPRYLKNPALTAEWPERGNISFVDVCVRYRPGMDLVLKHVTFDVRDGDKIGVVGRTGAGKSSLMLALFRLIELSQGKILVDGLDISKIGLYELRQNLTILPQDPVLFTGSLRSNFDPFQQFSDEDIWKSIEQCHLKSFVQSLPEKLEFSVGEGGDNLSIGQRQLVCLGRALLRKTKILVLDEATAAVDVETDKLIQETIRAEFKSCTVLTIAHRLNTIMDYDRILVLTQGTLVEFDMPSALLSDHSSVFYSMVAETQVAPPQSVDIVH